MLLTIAGYLNIKTKNKVVRKTPHSEMVSKQPNFGILKKNMDIFDIIGLICALAALLKVLGI